MVRSFTSVFIIFLISFNLNAGTYSGGDGSPGDPYQIANTDDLLELSKTVADWGSYFIQTSDITFNSDSTLVDWDRDGTADWDFQDQMGFDPIGHSGINFTGDYDGQGYIITNLFIDRSSEDYVGLFGYTDAATISDIGLLNVDITGDSNVGGVLGYNSSSTISRSYSTGNITGNSFIGGLVGRNIFSSDVNSSYSTCSVTANNGAGGLVGDNENLSTVRNSYSTGDVTRASGSSANFGGFCGFVISSSEISDSYSTGSVIYNGAPDPTDKGFVGYEYGSNTYTDNFFDSEASNQNTDAIGGATPKTTEEMKDFRTYTDQSTTGLTTAWDFVSNPNDDVVNNDYWDMDQDWSVNNGYPILSIQTEADNILAFNGGHGTSGSPFQIDNLTNLMILSLSPQYWDSEYIQTSDIAATATQYWDDADDDSDGHPYNDANDLTSSGNNEGFSPIGNTSLYFTGNYDGQGNEISNLYIDRNSSSIIGLFGYINGATISYIGLTDIDITGSSSVGGLVGYSIFSSSLNNSYSTGVVTGILNVGGIIGFNNSSSVSNSYSTVSVLGNIYVGGLVGWNFNSVVSNSYSLGDVSGIDYVGGLAGTNINSTISTSYSTGDVTGSSGANISFGGFCGYNDDAEISNSYSIGSVIYTGNPDPTDKGFVGSEGGTNTYIDNFFDSEASNQNTDAVGSASPKTTAEMKSSLTFLNAGWDFLDETDNGTNDYWGINNTDNNGYPWLEWQGFSNNLGILPTISTNSIQILGDSKAKSGGIISDIGESLIIAKGLCWNTTGTPTLSDDYTDDGTGDSGYTSLMTGLQVNTQYYVRAYATNSYGTGYGDEKSFIYTAIPTLPEWGLIIFGGLIAFYGIKRIYNS